MPGKRLIAITMSAGVLLKICGTTPAADHDKGVYLQKTGKR